MYSKTLTRACYLKIQLPAAIFVSAQRASISNSDWSGLFLTSWRSRATYVDADGEVRGRYWRPKTLTLLQYLYVVIHQAIDPGPVSVCVRERERMKE